METDEAFRIALAKAAVPAFRIVGLRRAGLAWHLRTSDTLDPPDRSQTPDSVRST